MRSAAARQSGGKFFAALFGGLGALAVHVLVLLPALSGHVFTNPRHGVGSVSQGNSAYDGSESTLQLIDLSAVSLPEDPAARDIIARESLAADVPIKLLAPDPTFAFGEDDAAAPTSPADLSKVREASPEDALIYSRYLALVSERISRIWTRPRTKVEGGIFECSVRVEQDRQGNVLSVEVQACNGGSDWQDSLLVAIERASPLSSAPNGAFSTFLDLRMLSLEFAPGVPNESEYAPDLLESHRTSGINSRQEFLP